MSAYIQLDDSCKISGMPCGERRSRGFTLIEVLITVVILSVGLLGIAAMQLKGLQYNHDAYLRSQINVLATDIAERMRLNRDNAASYISTYSISTAPSGCVAAGGANAANDLLCWQLRVFNTLPNGGSAAIAADGDLYKVTLSWNDRENTSRPVTYTFMP